MPQSLPVLADVDVPRKKAAVLGEKMEGRP